LGTFDLEFLDLAHDEWFKLDSAVAARHRKKLQRRLEQPRIESQRLHGSLAECFKIRDDKSGTRVIYLVEDDRHVVLVVTVGKRTDGAAYRIAQGRLH
jgi:mRNA interferase RelE/StbE